MKRLALVTGLFALIAGLSASAQSLNLTANIPFAFQAGEKVMPAGSYELQPSGTVVLIRAVGGHQAAYILTNATHRNGDPIRGVLEFHGYGGSYFLAKIWSPGEADGRSLPMTPREKEVARNFRSVETARVALASR